MIKLKFPYFIFVNLFLCLVGIVLILVGIIQGGEINQPLLESIGLGLIAAGVVNILDRSFSVEPTKQPPAAPPPPSAKEMIVLAAYKRSSTPPEIFDLKFDAVKVDVIGVTLNYVIDELQKSYGEKVISNLLNNNLQLRLFMVHPDSQFLKQRALEDCDSYERLRDRQVEAVEKCVKFFHKLNARYDVKKVDTRFKGTLQIKLLDFCPYITIYRINDDRIYWGLYSSGTTGMNLPLFLTTPDRDPDLYGHLHDHIHGLIEHDTKYPDLVTMTKVGLPELNQAAHEQLLKEVENRKKTAK
jgi:hypothetical protein